MRTAPLFFSVLALVGCAGGGSGTLNPATWSGGMSGAMELRLVDAPNPDVTAVVVTIDKVDAHLTGAGWVTLASQKVTVDLLTLQNGTFAKLGVTALPAGQLTQIRLYTDDAGPNYVITPDGAQHPLDVPSGDESGIKLKLGLDIQPCASGNITIDFDAHKSIWVHPRGAGAGDLWNLRPVIRLSGISQTGTCSGDGGATPPAAPPIDGTPPAPSPAPLPGPEGSTTPNPNPPTLGSGAPTTCGGAVCADGDTCVNGVCTAAPVIM